MNNFPGRAFIMTAPPGQIQKGRLLGQALLKKIFNFFCLFRHVLVLFH
jgi:hypothetical protein